MDFSGLSFPFSVTGFQHQSHGCICLSRVIAIYLLLANLLHQNIIFHFHDCTASPHHPILPNHIITSFFPQGKKAAKIIHHRQVQTCQRHALIQPLHLHPQLANLLFFMHAVQISPDCP